MSNQKVKVDLCAYTNKNSRLETTVVVKLNRDEKKMAEEAIKLGKKFWYNYDKAFIQQICVDFIHYQ